MDLIEIRMWSGLGKRPEKLPIRMRGFVSTVSRSQGMSSSGKPVRNVNISGMDFGKIWQTFQVLYFPAYVDGKLLLTNYNMMEAFGVTATATISAGEYIRQMIEKIINRHIADFLPRNPDVPYQITPDISVKTGVIGTQYQNNEGSIYSLMSFYGDVGAWNELFIQDREDGVYAVYRPNPALKIAKPNGQSRQKIQTDAPDPVFVKIPAHFVLNNSYSRSDDNVANFYWVNNQKYDFIDDLSRKLMALRASDGTVDARTHQNCAVKYYGVRMMNVSSNQGPTGLFSENPGLKKDEQASRGDAALAWINNRRKIIVETNRDNVVFEKGNCKIKGGLERDDGTGLIQAGDFAVFKTGTVEYSAYITEVVDEFMPFQSYTSTLNYERGEGFITRTTMGIGKNSPWLAELSGDE
jgi:hypothetical protein